VPTNTQGDAFFIEGKGLKKIWGMKSERRGLGSFHNGHLTYSPDGFVHMLFAYGLGSVNGAAGETFLYRKKISLNSGVATDGTFPSSAMTFSSFTEENGSCFLIPYTDKFAYRSSDIIFGEPTWLPKSGFSYYVPKIYENQQIAMSYFLDFNQKTYASYFTNGIHTASEKIIMAPNFCSSLELSTAGLPLLFTAGNPTLQVHDFANDTQLSSMSINLFQNYTSFPPQEAKLRTKRSADGTKIIGLIIDNDHRILSYTTFIYDIAAHTFTKKIDDYILKNTSLIVNVDMDEQGNIFYPTTQGASYQIKKVTPAGETVVSSDFMTTGYIINVKCIDGKVFVVLSENGNSTYSDDRGKGTILLTVLE